MDTDYRTLLNRQMSAHSEIFNRVSYDLGASEQDRAKPTEELLAEQKQTSTPIPALYERMFYAGRYSSAPGGCRPAAHDRNARLIQAGHP